MPYLVWVDFEKVDFSKNAPVKKLTLTDGIFYAGEVSDFFKETKPFTFLEAQ